MIKYILIATSTIFFTVGSQSVSAQQSSGGLDMNSINETNAGFASELRELEEAVAEEERRNGSSGVNRAIPGSLPSRKIRNSINNQNQLIRDGNAADQAEQDAYQNYLQSQ